MATHIPCNLYIKAYLAQLTAQRAYTRVEKLQLLLRTTKWRTERKCKLSWLRMLRRHLLRAAVRVAVAAVVSSGMVHEYSWRLPGQSFIHS